MKFPQISSLFSNLLNELKPSSVYKQKLKQKTTQSSIDFNSTEILHSSLKQLEFITFLEIHLSKRNLDEYSLKFLIELDKVKVKAKKNTINSLRYYKK